MLTIIQHCDNLIMVELQSTTKYRRKEVNGVPDIALLKKKMDESGMTMVAISAKSGILRETLYNRMNGKGEFLASEIVGLTKALNLSKTEREKIFFV